MPGDAVHVSSAKWFAAFGAIVLYTGGFSIPEVIAAVLLFTFGVLFLSPDLDLPDTKPIKRWGKLGFCWLPFERYIPHRSCWSHGWFLGAITIHLYFVMLLVIPIAFMRVCWLPLIEPLIIQGNLLIDGIISLNLTSEIVAGCIFVEAALYTAHLHHKLLDTFMKNKG